MSEHLHSHAEAHSCSVSKHSLQFELRSTAPSSPFLFPSTPNLHVPAPTLNLSFKPTPFCGRLPDVHPLSLPPQLLVPDPPTQLCPRQLFYTPLSTFLAKIFASEFWESSWAFKQDEFPALSLHVCFRSFRPYYVMSAFTVFQHFIQEVLTLWEMFDLNKQKGSVVSESRCCSSRSRKWKNVGSWTGGKPWHKLSAISSNESRWNAWLTRLLANIIRVRRASVSPPSQQLCLRQKSVNERNCVIRDRDSVTQNKDKVISRIPERFP